MKHLLTIAAFAAAVPVVASAQTAPVPPTVEQRPHSVKGPVTRNDPYYWLRDDTRKNPAMLAYLNAENAYADSMLASTKHPTIPLTTNEYDEWGNPENREYYDYMLSYSPYDNVRAQAYPAMFVGTGLWDSQVQYYEPAK